MTNTVYVAGWSPSLSIVNGTSGKVESNIPRSTQLEDIAVNPRTNAIYLVNLFGSTVSVVDSGTRFENSGVINTPR